MKTLIIGNSHMAALANAIKIHRKPLDIDFIAKAGRGFLADLKIDRGFRLHSTNPGIRNQIAQRKIGTLSDYSSIIIYGCGLRSSGRGLNWFQHIKQSSAFCSKSLSKEIIDDFITKSMHYKFLAKNRVAISTLRNTRFTSVPCPMPNEIMPACSDWPLSNKRAEITSLEMEAKLNDLGVDYLNTPEELVNSDGVATQAKFKNSRDGDFSHLNDEGGEIVLGHIVSYLSR